MRIFAMLVSVFWAFGLFADEVLWKGGGDSPRWSDGTNWEGGAAPNAGDIAVIPDGTTAWASHHTAANGGDLTLIKSLAGIKLDGENAVFDLDSENDGVLASATYTFGVPVTGTGVFKLSNGVNNDRHVELTADNSAFQGTFHFYHLQVWVGNLHALGTTNLVKWEPHAGLHGLYFHVAGTYQNPIDVYSVNSVYPLVGANISASVVLSGRITNKGGGVFCPNGNGGYTTFTGGIDNGAYNYSQCRIQGNAIIAGEGIYGSVRVYTGQAATLAAPITGAFMCSGGTLTCGAADVLKAELVLWNSDPKNGTLDLNGYDQAPTKLSFQGMSEANGSATVITSAAPAKLSVSGLASASTWYTYWGHIQGAASLEFTGANNNAKIPFANSSNTKGELTITNKGTYEFLSTCSFSNVKRIAILDGTSKYSTTKLLLHTANINPGRFDLELIGDYAIAEIDEGVQVDAKVLKTTAGYLAAGVYGSQAACDAGTVDANHVLANLAGLGTVKVELSCPPGLIFAVR